MDHFVASTAACYVLYASNAEPYSLGEHLCRRAVAQWLEQGTHNPSVVGSIPTGPTSSYSGSFSVVVSRLENHDVLSVYEIHQPMLLINSPRPAAS